MWKCATPVLSAGTPRQVITSIAEPRGVPESVEPLHVHPEVFEVMRELGIDLPDRTPKPLTRELAEQADIVITMRGGDECPYIPGKRYID